MRVVLALIALIACALAVSAQSVAVSYPKTTSVQVCSDSTCNTCTTTTQDRTTCAAGTSSTPFADTAECTKTSISISGQSATVYQTNITFFNSTTSCTAYALGSAILTGGDAATGCQSTNFPVVVNGQITTQTVYYKSLTCSGGAAQLVVSAASMIAAAAMAFFAARA